MRVAIATLGCKVNQYDTAVIEKRFDDLGWARVEFGAEADAYVVNSCTVTDRADAEARRLARRARRTNPSARVIMTGCYAQVSPAAIAEMDSVDYVVGLGRLDDLLRAVAGELTEKTAVSDLRQAREVAVAQPHGGAVRRLKPRHRLQQRGLARAVGPQDHDDLRLADTERCGIDGAMLAVLDGEARDLKHRSLPRDRRG